MVKLPEDPRPVPAGMSARVVDLDLGASLSSCRSSALTNDRMPDLIRRLNVLERRNI